MAQLVALLRAVNVGGTGMLSMRDLVSIATEAAFSNPRTYIQSGNLLFESSLPAAVAKKRLEEALLKETGKPVAVAMRTAAQLRQIEARNPFPSKAASQVAVIFLLKTVSDPALDAITGTAGEQVRSAGTEIYLYYPEGMGKSKLKLPKSALEGTARNMNTVSKLVALCKASA